VSRLRGQPVPLRHQAVIRLVLVALVCLLAGGCARLLQTLIAPQSTAASAANDLANRATAGAGQELDGMAQEVSRLRALRDGDASELDRISQELQRRKGEARTPAGSAQREVARRQPWDLRAPPAPGRPADNLVVARRPPSRARGLPARSAPLPDGTPRAQLTAPVDLGPIRSMPGPGGHVRSQP
jgi:hypothetical protein